MKTSEEKNEIVSVMINVFTRVVTFIFLVMIFKTLIAGEVNKVYFSIKDVAGILLMGFISGIAVGIFYIKKNKKPIAFLKTALYNGERRRGVAQLVEHYLREVGAACSNHVTPIE